MIDFQHVLGIHSCRAQSTATPPRKFVDSVAQQRNRVPCGQEVTAYLRNAAATDRVRCLSKEQSGQHVLF